MIQPNHNPQPLCEALQYKDMEGMIKPEIHVDEFAAKMGDDEEIIVVSFFVRNELAARDLVTWFETGYDWVLDAERSPGELSPGRFLVYVEMRRRSSAGKKIADMLGDLNTLTEFDESDWKMQYRDKVYDFSQETFDRVVPLSPKSYRKQREDRLNEVRAAAGIEHRTVYEVDSVLASLQSAAGI